MIYATSELAFYCGLKPNEFWDMEYKEVVIYCQCVLANNNDRFKEQIILQEAQTNKMIKANPYMNKYPKVESLQEVFGIAQKSDFNF